jgi:hypothetical protein
MPGSEAGSDTICPSCNAVVIKRSGYVTKVIGLTDEGRCSSCNEEIMRWI